MKSKSTDNKLQTAATKQEMAEKNLEKTFSYNN